MDGSGEAKKDLFKTPYFWAIVAGVVIVLNGIIQLFTGNMPLGIASLVVGGAAIVFGIVKPGKKPS